MSISTTQLAKLAKEYHFNVTEALEFLNQNTKKSATPIRCVGGECKPKKLKTVSQSGDKKARSGYQYFMKSKALSFTEASKQWKALSDGQRKKWNDSV
jgi:hypothetical protein